MRHLNLSVVDDRHFADLLLIARIHLLNAQKKQELRDFYEMMPEKFNNKTNGITQRRFLLHANPLHFDTVVLTDIFCKANLVLIFDVHEFLLSFFIVRINAKLGKCRQICDPLVSDMIRYPVSQQRICMQRLLRNDAGEVQQQDKRYHTEKIFTACKSAAG